MPQKPSPSICADRGHRGQSVLGIVGVVAGQPGCQPFDGHLEFGILVDEVAEAGSQPGETDALATPPFGEFFDAAVGEIQLGSQLVVQARQRGLNQLLLLTIVHRV